MVTNGQLQYTFTNGHLHLQNNIYIYKYSNTFTNGHLHHKIVGRWSND